MTGMNDQKMGLSEIGAGTASSDRGASHSPDFPSESREGQTFTWTLKDIMLYDQTADAGIKRMEEIPRTCNLILGLGDGKPESQKMYGIASDAGRLTTFDDTNQQPLVWDEYPDGDNVTSMDHERIPSVVYWGMDWYCPQYHKPLGDRLKENWGKI